ncbi:hypothetical protein [Streptomyces sp. TRM68367]|uniref:hypothetical protein n=1 Tax=Streptomyces sp. TRM68367 TaxID=2758415 RepID=UPI00165C2F77|nr:hypothetical protein [Streptomyces sp. TRM68367]MBC9731418.1 hypothetical protein [Streptomyces sp. TRM68367]
MQTHAMRTAARERVTAARHQLDLATAVLALRQRAAARHRRQISKADGSLLQCRSEQRLLPADFSSKWIEAADAGRTVREQALREEEALTAAYEVVAAAHRLALGTAHREVHPVPERGTVIAPANPVAHAVNYTATYASSHDGDAIDHPAPLSADRVEFVLGLWQKVPSARILLDASCTYTVALPGSYIELRPVDEPAPTEGDVLHAALGAYGLPSSPMWECGITYRVIPLDTTATSQDVHTGPRLFVQSGESADRPIDAHEEPWTITLHNADGDQIRTLYSGSHVPGNIAEESADCAKFAASWIRDNAHAHLPGF